MTKEEFWRRLVTVYCLTPSLSDRRIADKFDCSVVTARRWLLNESAPCETVRKYVISTLEEELSAAQFMLALALAVDTNIESTQKERKAAHAKLAARLCVATPMIQRWLNGKNLPHPHMRGVLIDIMNGKTHL